MKCSIIRDLLPLYAENMCSKLTSEVIEKHIESCNECKEVFNNMKKCLIERDFIEEEKFYQKNNSNKEVKNDDRIFWMRYYKDIYIKGISIFLIIYCILILVGIICI